MAEGLHPIFLLEEAVKMIGLVDAHGHSLIPNNVLYSWAVMGLLIFFGWLATKNISMVPRGVQNFFEFLIGSLEDFVVTNMGEDGRKVFPVLATLFIYIFCCNVSGLIPGGDSPTANINTNASMAVFVFLYYNYWGIRRHGIKYIKHFMGPYWWLAPIMFPIEIVSHLARPLSLTLRLFGNIMGEDIVLALLFILAPVVSTLPMYFLFLLADFIQAFVFFMLSMLYLKGAFEEAH
ncbi:ATP synthase F0 subcomplex A subunit [Desulfonauticus submarinus]|uniref:ATP synthase subunit a n=1 Tax=Desulfonauticus submarinus TaxID=206665 RepID=A0A1H0BC62_9BACT|nr:F0F1 ATP synthase subunit A [Desulfonauticus submarinus]SDN43198.1 ATP synthase F0 subcomplex A subunit [Desulfonauticus submarinus]